MPIILSIPWCDAHISEMMIEPGAMQAWIVSSRVATVRSGTAYMKTSLVSRQIPPKIHYWGRTRPAWFLRRDISVSSISTCRPGPPTIVGVCKSRQAQISRRKFFQSTAVVWPIDNSSVQNLIVARFLDQQ